MEYLIMQVSKYNRILLIFILFTIGCVSLPETTAGNVKESPTATIDIDATVMVMFEASNSNETVKKDTPADTQVNITSVNSEQAVSVDLEATIEALRKELLGEIAATPVESSSYFIPDIEDFDFSSVELDPALIGYPNYSKCFEMTLSSKRKLPSVTDVSVYYEYTDQDGIVLSNIQTWGPLKAHAKVFIHGNQTAKQRVCLQTYKDSYDDISFNGWIKKTEIVTKHERYSDLAILQLLVARTEEHFEDSFLPDPVVIKKSHLSKDYEIDSSDEFLDVTPFIESVKYSCGSSTAMVRVVPIDDIKNGIFDTDFQKCEDFERYDTAQKARDSQAEDRVKNAPVWDITFVNPYDFPVLVHYTSKTYIDENDDITLAGWAWPASDLELLPRQKLVRKQIQNNQQWRENYSWAKFYKNDGSGQIYPGNGILVIGITK